MISRLPAMLGMAVIILIAYLLSTNRKAINKKTFIWGLSLQILFAIFVLKGGDISVFLHSIIKLPFIECFGIDIISLLIVIVLGVLIYFCYKKMDKDSTRKAVLWVEGVLLVFFLLYGNLIEGFFDVARVVVSRIIDYTIEGANFVFGPLALNKEPWGVVFAFQVLPTIIFVASIFAILYYLGIMQKVVGALARFMSRFMGTSGAESTGVAANIFMGQTESPLTIRPYLESLTMSELMTLMASGMASVSGGIMTAYVMIAGVDIKHLLAAVIMTAPGSIMLAKMMVPETDKPRTGKEMKIEVPVTDVNVIDAAARGASEGGLLALNVAGMLIAFIALIALINGGFGYIHSLLASIPGAVGGFLGTVFPTSMEQLTGWIFAPLAWLMGVAWHDAPTVGSLMGTRMVLNEFVAFLKLGEIQGQLDPRSFIITTYALCGFANLSSIAIQIGGIGSLAPSRRHDLAKLGLRAMLAGTLANFLTATIAGILL